MTRPCPFRTHTPLLPLLLAALPLGLSCGDKDADDSGSDDGTAVTWAQVETALANSCAFSSCHGGQQFPDLGAGKSHAAIVGVASEQAAGMTLVVPGDPDQSYLLWKIEGAAGIEEEGMPKGSGSWDPDSIALVRAWIEAGAPSE